MKQNLYSALREALPRDVPIRIIDGKELQSKINKIIKQSNAPVISFDRLYIPPSKNVVYLDTARLTSPKTEEAGSGLRPIPALMAADTKKEINSMLLSPERAEDAISKIQGMLKKTGGNKVLIADVGYFPPDEVAEEMVRELKGKGIDVEIISGITSREQVERFRGMGAKTRSVETLPEFYEWIEARDFYPLMPASGRVSGVKTGRGYLPFGSYERVRTGKTHTATVLKPYSLSYIYPFADPKTVAKWSSIPEGKAAKFGEKCLQDTIRMFRMLEEKNRRKITLRNLAMIRRPTGEPYVKGKKPARLDASVVRILENAARKAGMNARPTRPIRQMR
jgi:hypothetical protein